MAEGTGSSLEMLCEMIFKQSCGISLVDGTVRCPIGRDLDQREWPVKLCIVVHGGSCCLQSTSAKKSLYAFLGQDGTKLEFYFII